MIDWYKIKPFVYSLLISLGVGGLSALLTRNGIETFETVEKSSLTPPGFVFSIVWTVLYILMGISAALVYRSDSPEKGTALTIYGIQLLLNFFWSIIYFNMQNYLFAFVWIILLWFAIIAMVITFTRANRLAGILQIPYLLWVTFAAYLSFTTWILNR